MAEIKKVYKNGTAYDVLNSDTVVDAVIPSQSGNSGKFLTTDGSDVSWANVDALPSQTSQSGKFLTTDGTTASWANVDALPTQTGQSGKFLTTNGTTASWATVEEGITKIFTLSSTSDLTTAQAAFNWIIAGNVSYIRISGTNYIYVAQGTSVPSTFTGNFAFLHRNTKRSIPSIKISKLSFQNIVFVVSSGTVTGVKQLTDLSQEVVSSLPSTPDDNTIYFITGS